MNHPKIDEGSYKARAVATFSDESAIVRYQRDQEDFEVGQTVSVTIHDANGDGVISAGDKYIVRTVQSLERQEPFEEGGEEQVLYTYRNETATLNGMEVGQFARLFGGFSSLVETKKRERDMVEPVAIADTGLCRQQDGTVALVLRYEPALTPDNIASAQGQSEETKIGYETVLDPSTCVQASGSVDKPASIKSAPPLIENPTSGMEKVFNQLTDSLHLTSGIPSSSSELSLENGLVYGDFLGDLAVLGIENFSLMDAGYKDGDGIQVTHFDFVRLFS